MHISLVHFLYILYSNSMNLSNLFANILFFKDFHPDCP